MSDMKPTGVKVLLGGKEYALLFSINAIDDIQDHFDIPISAITDLLHDERKVYKVLKYLLMTLINEGSDDAESGEPHVDEKWVGRKLTPGNMTALKSKILLAFTDGAPETEDDDPNRASGQ